MNTCIIKINYRNFSLSAKLNLLTLSLKERKHFVARDKSETDIIESVNSSIRDNLAGLNRKSKRFSKCYNMLKDTLLLFFKEKQFSISKMNSAYLTFPSLSMHSELYYIRIIGFYEVSVDVLYIKCFYYIRIYFISISKDINFFRIY